MLSVLCVCVCLCMHAPPQVQHSGCEYCCQYRRRTHHTHRLTNTHHRTLHSPPYVHWMGLRTNRHTDSHTYTSLIVILSIALQTFVGVGHTPCHTVHTRTESASFTDGKCGHTDIHFTSDKQTDKHQRDKLERAGDSSVIEQKQTRH